MEQTISSLFTVERRIVMEIREVGDGNAKKEICDTVLHRLPEWFGIEESIAEYVSLVEEMPARTERIQRIQQDFLQIRLPRKKRSQ